MQLIAPPSEQPHLEKKDEVVANVIWRFLELRGHVIYLSEILDTVAHVNLHSQGCPRVLGPMSNLHG